MCENYFDCLDVCLGRESVCVVCEGVVNVCVGDG